jgi:hypothetical protein
MELKQSDCAPEYQLVVVYGAVLSYKNMQASEMELPVSDTSNIPCSLREVAMPDPLKESPIVVHVVSVYMRYWIPYYIVWKPIGLYDHIFPR